LTLGQLARAAAGIEAVRIVGDAGFARHVLKAGKI
jgi:hypothetical protein